MPDISLLLVDDMESARIDIQEALRDVGVEPAIDFRRPADRRVKFGCEMPAGEELQRYDLAIVDLELFPPLRTMQYAPEDLRGGTEVLPYLRQEAPWLPVVGFSRLYQEESEYFLAVGGGFGFDGHVPRQLFAATYFNRKMWDGIVGRARRVREEALFDQVHQSGDTDPEFDSALSDSALGTVNEDLPGWRAIAATVFHFARKVVVKQVSPGFSGARVFQVFAQQEAGGFSKEGVWLLKVSRSPYKLWREARAHQLMTRAGIDFARSVPLLWRWPVVEKGIGGIAYQFAEETAPAVQWLSEGLSVQELSSRLEPLLRGFYRDRGKDRGVVASVLNSWLPRLESVGKGLSRLADCRAKTLVGLVMEGRGGGELAEVVEYQRAWIHGDLHLGNILLGERDLLIDFAHSAAGPIVSDLARLSVDLRLRSEPATREGASSHWSAPWAGVEGLASDFGLGEGDRRLFDTLSVVWFCGLLGFEASDGQGEERLLRILESY